MLSRAGHSSPKASHLQGLSSDPLRRQKCSFAPNEVFCLFSISFIAACYTVHPSVLPVSALKVFISVGTSENIF